MSQLPELVQAMLDPKTYPETPASVQLMQTQMSFVFIAGDFVYKVKKPVNLGYLDYTTLAKRRFFCQREVELNRRLCPDTYLGVIPIVKVKGKINLGGRGKVIDCAVKMRYLPQDRMMNALLANNQVSVAMVARVAQRLAEFHQQAETNATISAFGDVETIRVNTEENFDQTEKSIGRTISPEQYRRIKNYTHRFIEDNASLFRHRVARGRVRDCHGDLHAAHICFTDGICIYDCIEFNDRFRYCDVASEIAFLAMDLDHYGRADLSRAFVRAYVAASQDKELLKLLNFYRCYRAYVRGKVESFKLEDPYIPETEKAHALETASSYFDLASFYTRTKPVLFITVGLVGTGKTVIAQSLAQRLGLIVISSDVTRKQLAGIPLTEHRFEDFSGGIYSAKFSRRTYDTMLTQAKGILSEGGSVILDASFIKAVERRKAKALAQETGADFFILECILDERLIKKRLTERLAAGTISDGRVEILEPQKKQFEPVSEVPEASHAVIDSAKPMELNIKQVLEKIGEEG